MTFIVFRFSFALSARVHIKFNQVDERGATINEQR